MLHRRTTRSQFPGDPVTAVGNDAVGPAAAVDRVGLTVVGEDHVSSISTRDVVAAGPAEDGVAVGAAEGRSFPAFPVSRSAPPFPQITSAREVPTSASALGDKCRAARDRGEQTELVVRAVAVELRRLRGDRDRPAPEAHRSYRDPQGRRLPGRDRRMVASDSSLLDGAGAARTPVRDQRLGELDDNADGARRFVALVGEREPELCARSRWQGLGRESAPSTRSAQRSAEPGGPPEKRLPGRSERLSRSRAGPRDLAGAGSVGVRSEDLASPVALARKCDLRSVRAPSGRVAATARVRPAPPEPAAGMMLVSSARRNVTLPECDVPPGAVTRSRVPSGDQTSAEGARLFARIVLRPDTSGDMRSRSA